MPAQPASLTPWARSGLALLCLLLAVSVGVRIYVYQQQSESGKAVGEAAGAPVDLGAGVLLPRSVAQHRSVQVNSCRAPASIDFVQASPYGSDPSLVGAPRPNLGSRFATASLNAIYFTRRAYARLAMRKNPATDDMAVKVIVPADCDASPNDVLTALRREARSSD
jgi:hypothetical protein